MAPGSHSGNGPAWILIGLLVVAVLALTGSFLSRRHCRMALTAVAAGGLGIQALHTFEHVAQFGYWAKHPSAKPWMTSFGMSIHSSFVHLGFKPPEALEVMHIFGNGVFLAGVVALWLLVREGGLAVPWQVRRGARWALMLETMHMVEHTALTVTVLTAHKAIGLSTGFGLIDPGPRLWSYRILWHLLFNVIPFSVVVATLVRWRAATRATVQQAPVLAGA